MSLMLEAQEKLPARMPVFSGRFFAIGLILIGWLAFLASLFLPATDIFEVPGFELHRGMTGLGTAISSIMIVTSKPLLLMLAPQLLLVFPIMFVNVMMLFYPMSALLRPRHAWRMALLFLPAVAVAGSLYKLAGGNVLIGFYLWIASFVLAATGCILISFCQRDGNDTIRFAKRSSFSQ